MEKKKHMELQHRVYSGIKIRLMLGCWLKRTGSGFHERLQQKVVSYDSRGDEPV